MSARAGLLLTACLGAVLLLPVGGARAAYPGQNGKLAFVRDGQIWTMNPDGTGEAQLTSGVEPASEPEWSPDGARILYARETDSGPEVRVMNADGSSDSPVAAGYSPTWFPDGTRIAFARDDAIYEAWPDGSDVHVINSLPAGSELTDLEWSPRGDEFAFGLAQGFARVVWANHPGSVVRRRIAPSEPADERAYGASWSPMAMTVAYVFDTFQLPEVARSSKFGSGQTLLTSTAVDKFETEWSPDGEKIVYSGVEPGCPDACNSELHVMDSDGTGSAQLTHTPSGERHPDWQPVIASPLPGYPRPQAAPSVRVSLVPAHAQCVAPNRTHGPPLGFDSCSPPRAPFEFPWLTVGTPDANGAPAKMTGWARARAVLGDPATPANEADIGVAVQVTDVRCRIEISEEPCTNANAQAGTDYGGDIELRLPLRITDRYNLPAPAADGPGTGDTTMSFFGSCAITADTAVGSSCSIGTSANAVIPGAVREGRRSIVELSQIEVRSSVTSEVFLRQGILVP
jgi:hypothetical protein